MPRDRRRRTRRRSAGPFLVASAVTLVVLALAVGAVLSVQNASAPYRRAVNRSFAAQGSVLADQSTAEGRQLRQLMADLPTLKRARLQERLDAMVETTTAQAAAAHDLVPPYPPSGTGPALLSVFDARAAAVADLRSAIDGLLGLEPLPTVGAPASSASTGTDSRGATLLSASRAVGDLEAVGASLERADGTYASVRGVLATAAGNAQMPRSIWVTHHVAWSPAALSTLVGELTTSGSLATNHALELVTVSILPAAVPPPSGPAPPGGVTTVPPTSTLTVSVVLRDSGNVAEHGVVVTASVRRLHSAVAHFHSQRISLDPGTAQAISFAPLPVSPGHDYTLAIGVTSASSPNSAGPSTSYTVAVAPATPPTTTTTTTATTTTTRPTQTTTTHGTTS